MELIQSHPILESPAVRLNHVSLQLREESVLLEARVLLGLKFLFKSLLSIIKRWQWSRNNMVQYTTWTDRSQYLSFPRS